MCPVRRTKCAARSKKNNQGRALARQESGRFVEDTTMLKEEPQSPYVAALLYLVILAGLTFILALVIGYILNPKHGDDNAWNILSAPTSMVASIAGPESFTAVQPPALG